MYLAQILEIVMPIIAAMTPEIVIVIKIINKFEVVIVLRSSEIAAAEPERALFIA